MAGTDIWTKSKPTASFSRSGEMSWIWEFPTIMALNAESPAAAGIPHRRGQGAHARLGEEGRAAGAVGIDQINDRQHKSQDDAGAATT